MDAKENAKVIMIYVVKSKPFNLLLSLPLPLPQFCFRIHSVCVIDTRKVFGGAPITREREREREGLGGG